MTKDLRFAAQMLLKHPAFTVVAVLTLALGVGANTALFSVVDAVLLKKLPVKDPNRLVLFKASWNREKFGVGGFNGSNRMNRATGLTEGTSFPLQTLTRLRQENAVVSDVFAFSPMALNLNAGGQAEVVSGQVVSGNYYSALGVPALIGRTITDADDNAGATPVAVLSHRFWTNRFGSDPSVVGRQVNINNVAFTVVGVTPAGFSGAGEVGSTQDISIPIAREPQVAGEQSNMIGAGIWWLRMMGRLQPGVTIEQAEVALAGPFQQDGKPRESEAKVHNVRENFLSTMEIPLLMGRSLTAQDDAKGPHVAVVNQAFAREHFGNENPIGKRFSFGPDNLNEIEIVGLAGDAKYTSQRDEIQPTVYQPWRQSLGRMNATVFEVRTAGDPLTFVAPIREAMREVERNLPLSNIRTQVQQADETLTMERMFAKLLTLFGLIAQQLAAIGLYGVMAYSVSQRTQEIGIRMALGADRRNVLMMVVRQGMALTVIGIAIGLGAAYVLMKYLESLTNMLFGVEARDPWTFAFIALFLGAVALFACLVPARRATKVDPLTALRYE